MSSEQEFPELSSLLERLGNSDSNLPLLLPFFLALANQQGSPNLTTSADRVIFLNPNTQSMMVVEGTTGSGSDHETGPGSDESGIESMLRDMFGGKPGEPPASKASLEAMPEVEVAEAEKDCAICLEGYEVGGVAKEMPCKHQFHGACVEKWLRVHGTCPVCRYRMPMEEKEEQGEKNGGGGGEEGENGGRRRREIWITISIRNIERGATVDDDSSP